MSKTVRTRMAPSPTGFLHIGGLRTALFDYLYARKTGGKFVLRIEDTDRQRLVEGALENIVQSLHDFGIEADEGFYWKNKIDQRGEHGPYMQSERLDIYAKHAQELIDKRAAYYCFCTSERLAELRKSQEAQKVPPKYDKHCLNLPKDEIDQKIQNNEPHVVRLNVPTGQQIVFEDVVHGKIEISSNDVDDQVLLKSDGFPTYHLAVVVDDHLMEITHVIRGDEWIPSTPKHILLYQAFRWELPVFVHLPLLLSKSRKKLSKRDGDVSVKDFLAQGYLPEALLNFVAFLGWNPKTEQEVFSLKELVENFDLEKINKSGAVFDLDKLDWINGLYIRKMDTELLLEKLVPYMDHDMKVFPKEFFIKIVSHEKKRLKKLSEIGERVGYFFKQPEYEGELLVWKKADKNDAKEKISKLIEVINSVDEKILADAKQSETFFKNFINENKLDTGAVLWPLRVALSGRQASPGPFELMEVFATLKNGRDEIISRLNFALKLLS